MQAVCILLECFFVYCFFTCPNDKLWNPKHVLDFNLVVTTQLTSILQKVKGFLVNIEIWARIKFGNVFLFGDFTINFWSINNELWVSKRVWGIWFDCIRNIIRWTTDVLDLIHKYLFFSGQNIRHSEGVAAKLNFPYLEETIIDIFYVDRWHICNKRKRKDRIKSWPRNLKWKKRLLRRKM